MRGRGETGVKRVGEGVCSIERSMSSGLVESRRGVLGG